MNVRIIAVGKLQSMYAPAQGEFIKRLSRYCKPELMEVPDEQAPENLSEASREAVMLAEWEKINRKLSDNDFLVVLDSTGEVVDSVTFSHKLDQWKLSGKRVVFALGGSLGFHPKALEKADWRLSLSHMTFTHSMARVILLEQIYRAEKISAGEPYHK